MFATVEIPQLSWLIVVGHGVLAAVTTHPLLQHWGPRYTLPYHCLIPLCGLYWGLGKFNPTWTPHPQGAHSHPLETSVTEMAWCRLGTFHCQSSNSSCWSEGLLISKVENAQGIGAIIWSGENPYAHYEKGSEKGHWAILTSSSSLSLALNEMGGWMGHRHYHMLPTSKFCAPVGPFQYLVLFNKTQTKINSYPLEQNTFYGIFREKACPYGIQLQSSNCLFWN